MQRYGWAADLMEIAIRCRVTGRVQGVFFPDSTRRLAVSLGLRGHAFNLPDGTVEVVVCGDKARVDELRQWLRDGPAQARVERLECESLKTEIPAGFVIG